MKHIFLSYGSKNTYLCYIVPIFPEKRCPEMKAKGEGIWKKMQSKL